MLLARSNWSSQGKAKWSDAGTAEMPHVSSAKVRHVVEFAAKESPLICH